MKSSARLLLFVAMISLLAATTFGQGRGGGRGGPPAPPKSPKEAAPFDITGYWEALITRDWRFRMLNPPKGDYLGLPLKPEARTAADLWDPAKDEAAGEQCRSYGAVNIMRMPGRFHFTWVDDQTLKVESDIGTQTRIFYFGAPKASGGDWQGVSQASWDSLPGIGRNPQPQLTGGLKVVTTKMKPGYLRRNGVPYTANAVLTEYFDRVTEPNGDSFLILTTTVDDPAYLTQPYLTSQNFKKQADASGWNPTPCAVK